jgi:hypothetical protein
MALFVNFTQKSAPGGPGEYDLLLCGSFYLSDIVTSSQRVHEEIKIVFSGRSAKSMIHS